MSQGAGARFVRLHYACRSRVDYGGKPLDSRIGRCRFGYRYQVAVAEDRIIAVSIREQVEAVSSAEDSAVEFVFVLDQASAFLRPQLLGTLRYDALPDP